MVLLAMLGVALADARAEDWSKRLRRLEPAPRPNFDPAGLQLASRALCSSTLRRNRCRARWRASAASPAGSFPTRRI